MRTLFSSLIIAMALMPLAAREVRPVKDDVGFCWNAASMKTLVDYLEAREKETFRTDGLVAAISPPPLRHLQRRRPAIDETRDGDDRAVLLEALGQLLLDRLLSRIILSIMDVLEWPLR